MKTTTLLAATFAVLAVTACGKPSSANLSLSARASTAGSTSNTTASSLDLGNGISLTEVRFVVRKLKLEGTSTTAAGATTAPSTTDAESDGKTEVEHEQDDDADEPVLGPLVVDLDGATLAGGGLSNVFEGVVPGGTFDELKFVIGPVKEAQAGSDAKLAAMAAQGASIVIDGTVTDASGTTTSFEFVSSLAVEVKQENDVEVNDTKSNNITLSIDPTGWFGGTGAARLDPTPANQAAIETNIKASLRAFQDDDKNGDEDHDGGDDGSSHD